MDPGVVRKAIEFNPKLLAYIKELSRQTGIPLDSLVNLAMYELIRRFGYLTPQPRAVPPPEGFDLLDCRKYGDTHVTFLAPISQS